MKSWNGFSGIQINPVLLYTDELAKYYPIIKFSCEYSSFCVSLSSQYFLLKGTRKLLPKFITFLRRCGVLI